MNEKVLSRYDIMTVGETAGVTVEEAQKYAGKNEHELNMVFQFEHVDGGKYGKWTDEPKPLTELKQILSKWQTQLYGKAWNSLFWDNHDQPRVVSDVYKRQEWRIMWAVPGVLQARNLVK